MPEKDRLEIPCLGGIAECGNVRANRVQEGAHFRRGKMGSVRGDPRNLGKAAANPEEVCAEPQRNHMLSLFRFAPQRPGMPPCYRQVSSRYSAVRHASA